MRPYFSLAGAYDSLTTDVRYEGFADFYESLFSRYGREPSTILDLACGTGTLTAILAQRGYEMIGVDASPEMLSVSFEKTMDCEIRPLLLCQRMEELDLYGTVDAAVCSLDGFNYLKPELLPEVFRRLKLFVEPGGLLIFDILTPEALREMDGQVCVDENDEIFCVWRAEYDHDENACIYGIDIFMHDEDEFWSRETEEHIEYAHSPETVCETLAEHGFTNIEIFGDAQLRAPLDSDRRIFIAAQRICD